jgi:tetratricopeptide (TPR) repeat protein
MSEANQARSLAAGRALLQAGNARGAARQFQAVLADDPAHQAALSGLVQAHLNLGETAQALETANGLLRVAPNLALGHSLRAAALVRLNKTTEALAAARQAVALAPRQSVGHPILAVVHAQRKEHAKAIAACKEGLALEPTNGFLMAQMASSLLETRGGKAAEPMAIEALKFSPDHPHVQRVAAEVALARGQVERARALLTTILRRNAQDRNAVSLYLLTEPRRHRYLRAQLIFRYWTRERRVLGVLVYFSAYLTLILLAVAISAVTRGLGFLLGLGLRFLLRAQYDAHRKAVEAHFTSYALKAGY